MITSAWSIIGGTVEVVTGARKMSLRIHRLLQPGLLELTESDRRRLLALQKRVECLVQPLNFLLLWSKKRDSCVHQVVMNAQELLFDVCSFIERFVPQEGAAVLGGGKNGAGGGSIDSDQLDYYLRELDFACSSVGMAVSIARMSDAPSMALQPTLAGDLAGSDALSVGSSSISLSAILRASRRIQEMRGRSGDLCACRGRLYLQPGTNDRASSADDDGAVAFVATGFPGGSGACSSSENVETVETDVVDSAWQPALSLATLKVIADRDTRLGVKRYSISVENRLSTRESGVLSDGGAEQSHFGLNTDSRLSFAIEMALDACLVTSSDVSLPAESSRCARDLGIDSLVLVWGGGTSASRSADEEFAVSSDFPDAVLVPESATESAPRPLRPQNRRLRSSSPSAMALAEDNVDVNSASGMPLRRFRTTSPPAPAKASCLLAGALCACDGRACARCKFKELTDPQLQ